MNSSDIHTEQLENTPPSIREMIELEQREKVRMTFSNKIADSITIRAGSMVFVWLNLAWFALWIVLHEGGLLRFDPYPYGLLTMTVSLEAIFLSVFVLISENRQALMSDKRAKLDLQVNLIAEQEITKIIEILNRMEMRLGISDGRDPDIKDMAKPTQVSKLAEQMEKLERVVEEDAAENSQSGDKARSA